MSTSIVSSVLRAGRGGGVRIRGAGGGDGEGLYARSTPEEISMYIFVQLMRLLTMVDMSMMCDNFLVNLLVNWWPQNWE